MKNSTIIIRVDEDTKKYLEKTSDRGISERVREIIDQSRKGSDKTYTMLKECAKEKGINFEEFVDSLHTQLIWGMVEYKDGKIIAPEDDELKMELDNLREACEEKGEDYLKAIRKTAQQIWSKRM